MSTAPIISDLQKANPSAVIELFVLTTNVAQHGSAQTYRFHAGSSLNQNGEIVWQGNSYFCPPVLLYYPRKQVKSQSAGWAY